MRYSKPARLIAVMTPVLGIVLAACGGSGTPAASPSSSSSAAATAAAAAGGSAAKITADWQAFFSAKTPIAQRVRLLENGQVFAALIRAQSGSALASSATAKVIRVSVVSPTQAKVTYSILIGGQSMLTGQAGSGTRASAGCLPWRMVARRPRCPRPAVVLVSREWTVSFLGRARG
jgi:hypothetical protein